MFLIRDLGSVDFPCWCDTKNASATVQGRKHATTPSIRESALLTRPKSRCKSTWAPENTIRSAQRHSSSKIQRWCVRLLPNRLASTYSRFIGAGLGRIRRFLHGHSENKETRLRGESLPFVGPRRSPVKETLRKRLD